MPSHILCNAGGVTVSHFEWTQNRGVLSWTPEEVNVRLRQMMLKAFDDVWRLSGEHDVEALLAAHALAIGRIAKATRTRGLFPRSSVARPVRQPARALRQSGEISK